MQLLRTGTIAASLCSLLSVSARGAVIASFDFGGTGGTGTYTSSATTTDPNVTVTPLTNKGTTNSINDVNANAAGSYPSRPVTSLRAGNTTLAADLGSQITSNNYVFFDVTAPAGGSVSLSSLSFDYAKGGTGTRAVGFKTDLDADFLFSDLAVAATRPTFANTGSIDLSGARFQNLTGTTRFEFFVATGSATSSIDADNIILNGTVVSVPEPASLSLLGAGGLALLTRRSRRARGRAGRQSHMI